MYLPTGALNKIDGQMGFYEEYKPFRNYMRRFSLVDSLIDVWRYSSHILNNKPLPLDYAVGKPRSSRSNITSGRGTWWIGADE